MSVSEGAVGVGTTSGPPGPRRDQLVRVLETLLDMALCGLVAAPTLFHRVRGRTALFRTVLEPHRGEPRVLGVAPRGKDGIVVRLAGDRTLSFSLREVLRGAAVPGGSGP